MKLTQIWLTESQLFQLKNLSATHNTSMADLICQAIDSYLENVTDIDHEEQKRRAIATAGQFYSGLVDLAADHDRYLDEADSDDDDPG